MWFQEGNFTVSSDDTCWDCKFNHICYLQERLLNKYTELENSIDFSVQMIQCNEYKEDINL